MNFQLTLLLIALAVTATAQDRSTFGQVYGKTVPHTQQLKDGAVAYNAGDAVDVPQGVDKPYMFLVTSHQWQTESGPRGEMSRKLKAWLETDKRLIKYRKESHFDWFYDNDPQFYGARTLANGQASSLRARVGDNFPILVLEDRDGQAAFKMSALSFPENAGELADWITNSLKAKAKAPPTFKGQTEATPIITEGVEQCGPDGCPPQPSPDSDFDDSEIVEDTPRPMQTPLLGYALLAVLGAGALGILAGATQVKVN